MKQTEVIKRMLPVVTSCNWDKVEDYLNFLREDLLETLAVSSDIRQINKLQGEILMLDKILNLPDTIKKLK